LVTEFLVGQTLRSALGKWRTEGKLTFERVLSVTSEIAHALGHLREHRIVHMDLCLDNIFVTETEKIKLLDFGSAMEVAGESMSLRDAPVLAKVGRVAPEVHRNQVWGNTDLFGLGTILFELLTGELPFGGEDTPGAYLCAEDGQYSDPRELNPNLELFGELDPILRDMLVRPEMRAELGAVQNRLRNARVQGGRDQLVFSAPLEGARHSGTDGSPQHPPRIRPKRTLWMRTVLLAVVGAVALVVLVMFMVSAFRLLVTPRSARPDSRDHAQTYLKPNEEGAATEPSGRLPVPKGRDTPIDRLRGCPAERKRVYSLITARRFEEALERIQLLNREAPECFEREKTFFLGVLENGCAISFRSLYEEAVGSANWAGALRAAENWAACKRMAPRAGRSPDRIFLDLAQVCLTAGARFEADRALRLALASSDSGVAAEARGVLSRAHVGQ
jgi:serine/threonine protein kinase